MALSSSSKGNTYEKPVDVCTVVDPKAVLYQQGEHVPYFIESGPECSLIKEKLSNKLVGKKINNTVLICSRGEGWVICTMRILATAQICEFSKKLLMLNFIQGN